MSLGPAPSAPLEEVEWRVDSEPSERGGKTTCRFVAYLDARIVANLLDQWVGAGNWSDTYEVGTVAGREAMWCRLSVKVGDEWVTKTDVGAPSNMEAQKGAVSDAFKRAGCLKWGCGRNVYDLPSLYAHCRTYTRGGKVTAVADGQKTLDDLLRQLRALGFDAADGKVHDAAPDDAPPGVDKETGEVVPSGVKPSSSRECVICHEPITGKVKKHGQGWVHDPLCEKPADDPNEEPF